jgi:glucose-1-phosphate adenylyltransferase
VTGFVEKPQTDPEAERMHTPSEFLDRRGIASRGRNYLASMGIYLFRRPVLFELLSSPPRATDFGKEIFPRSLRTHRVIAHLFDGYWEDLGTVKAFHEANLALASDNPPFDFNSTEGVIYTRMRFLPASRVSAARMEQCLISDGCVIQPGARIEHSVIGVRSRIGRNVVLRDTYIIGADRIETDAERAANRARGIPDFTVGDNTVIERAIVDKDCRIGTEVRIVNQRGLCDAEGDNYVIRDGIVVIPRGTTVPDGTVI